MNSDPDVRFRVSASVLTRLGEELITDSTQALLELIKNAYDADARTVTVDINTTLVTELPSAGIAPSPSENDIPSDPIEGGQASGAGNGHGKPLVGYVRISDTGHGMDAEAIRQGWLTLSASPKQEVKRRGETTAGKRVPLGDKGLGRLGAQRLGDLVRLRTRPTVPPLVVPSGEDPSTLPVVEHRVLFRFSDFRSEVMLDTVNVDWKTRDLLADGELSSDPWPLRTPWGTIIEIVGLHDTEEWQATGRLSRELSKVVNPFKGVEQLTITATIDGMPVDIERVGRSIRRAALTTWKATFDGRRVTIDGQLRPQHFRPRDKRELGELERLLLQDGGTGLAAAISATPALKPFKPSPGKDPYLVKLHRRVNLDDVGVPEGMPEQWWSTDSCGPFTMEIDTVTLQLRVMQEASLSVFDSQATYREWMRERAGIGIYRDGFRVAAGEDLLALAEGFTSGGSFYSLRPANVIGYVAISAHGNKALEETTDREGLRDTAASRTFTTVLRIIRDEINRAMDESGRAAGDYVKRVLRERADTDRSIDELSRETRSALERVATVTRSIGDVHDALAVATADEGLTGEHPELVGRLTDAATALSKTEEDLTRISRLTPLVEAMSSDMSEMRNELDETYQLIGLGLIAEALAHELTHSVRRLSERSKAIRGVIAAMSIRDPELDLFVEEVESVARGLRTQIRHLDPQLRYARERRRTMDLAELVRDTFEYHRERLRDEPIRLNVRASHAATVKVVPGRIMQVLDNLILNAEYWVRRELAKGAIGKGLIEARIEGARCIITDNGPGVDPELGESIFEPFVSGKAQGRGLGLFVSRQLLAAEDSTLSLRPRRDARTSDFVIDLSSRQAD